MSIMGKFFSSPTRMSGVVMSILALVLYAISPPDDSWVVVAIIAAHVVPVLLIVMIYEICSMRQDRNRTRRSSVNHFIGCDDCDALHHYLPSSEAFPTRRRLQELRLQIARLNREIEEFENLTYGDLSSANIFGIPSMNDEEINASPVHNYRGTGLESENAPPELASSSSVSAKESLAIGMPDDDGSCDELICNICLEQFMEGELVCSFSCIHQFHTGCIDRWLFLGSSCPVCNLC